jgi:hypothetical protein
LCCNCFISTALPVPFPFLINKYTVQTKFPYTNYEQLPSQQHYSNHMSQTSVHLSLSLSIHCYQAESMVARNKLMEN